MPKRSSLVPMAIVAASLVACKDGAKSAPPTIADTAGKVSARSVDSAPRTDLPVATHAAETARADSLVDSLRQEFIAATNMGMAINNEFDAMPLDFRLLNLDSAGGILARKVVDVNTQNAECTGIEFDTSWNIYHGNGDVAVPRDEYFLSKDFRFANGLRRGQTYEEVVAVLGRPYRWTGSVLTYMVGAGGTDDAGGELLVLFFRGDRLVAVSLGDVEQDC